MYTPEEIIDGAQAIRPHLKTLIGEEADGVDNELGELLSQAQAGQRVEMQILRIVAGHEATRKWLTDYVKEKKDQQEEANRLKSFNPLPGEHTALPLPRFRCPQGDYARRLRSDPIPHAGGRH